MVNSPSHGEDILICNLESVPIPLGQIHHVAAKSEILPRRALVLPMGKNFARKTVEQFAHVVLLSLLA